MIHRTLRALVIAGALLLLCSGGSVDENNPDAADWQSFSDEKVLEYLDNPFAGVRIYAGLEILRRWDEKKIIALCEKDWKKGQEVLYAGEWPHDGNSIEDALLGRFSEGATQVRVEEIACLLAGRERVPNLPKFDGRVGQIVRDKWFADWIVRIPTSTFFVGTVSLCLKNSWMRERLYRDDPWIVGWGAYRESETTWWYPWRLSEYRAVVQILAGDPRSAKTAALIASTEYFPALVAAVATGRNPVPANLKAQTPAGISDALAATVMVSGLGGSVAYAEMLAIVCDRPDWIPAIHRALGAVEYVRQGPVLDPQTGKVIGFANIVTHEDRRSPLVALMAEVSTHRNEAAKASFKAYWKREWVGYKDVTWREELFLRHPWFSFDKQLLAWYEESAKPIRGEVDCGFLKGEWR